MRMRVTLAPFLRVLHISAATSHSRNPHYRSPVRPRRESPRSETADNPDCLRSSAPRILEPACRPFPEATAGRQPFMYFRQPPAGLRRPTAPVPDVTLVTKADRRDVRARVALLVRVRAEFHEVPGLCISVSDARRLFDLREDICARILDRLVAEATLRRSTSGRYRHA